MMIFFRIPAPGSALHAEQASWSIPALTYSLVVIVNRASINWIDTKCLGVEVFGRGRVKDEASRRRLPTAVL